MRVVQCVTVCVQTGLKRRIAHRYASTEPQSKDRKRQVKENIKIQTHTHSTLENCTLGLRCCGSLRTTGEGGGGRKKKE